MASSATDFQSKEREIRQQLIETGDVDVMVSVGNNFFYTKRLPCTLWFYDRGKPAGRQDTVFFLDARDYYTVVDRTLNEWSEWQLKNLTAIVWLYWGEVEKYHALIDEYREELRARAKDMEEGETVATLLQEDFAGTEKALAAYNEKRRDISKEEIQKAKRKKKKELQTKWAEELAQGEELATIAREAAWLVEHFGEGAYRDIPGLCKAASRAEIAEKNYSLPPAPTWASRPWRTTAWTLQSA